MLLLTLTGCLSLMSTLNDGDDFSYEEPAVDVIDARCEADSLELDVFASGQGISRVGYRVLRSTGSSLHDGWLDEDPAYTVGSQTHWTAAGLAAPCDEDYTVEITAHNVCEEVTEEGTWTAPAVEQVSPSVGPITGGTPVLIGVEPGGYDFSSASVSFGEGASSWTPATGVFYHSGAACEEVGTEACLGATSPAYAGSAPVTVDLLVEDAAGRQLIASDAFTYVEDLAGEPVGLIRAQLIAFDPTWFWYGSGCGDIGSATQYTQFDILFHEPIDGPYHYWDAYPAPGECTWGGASFTQVDVGSYLRLEGDPLGTLTVADSGGGYYCTVDTANYAGYPGASLDLEVVDQGASTVVPQVISDAIRFPELMSASSFDDPSQPGYVHTDVTTVRGEDLVITWQNPGDLDGLNYAIAAVDGYSVLSEVSCSVETGPGELTLPWRDLVPDPASDALIDGFTLTLSFWLDTQAELPHDHSIVWARVFLITQSYVYVVEP